MENNTKKAGNGMSLREFKKKQKGKAFGADSKNFFVIPEENPDQVNQAQSTNNPFLPPNNPQMQNIPQAAFQPFAPQPNNQPFAPQPNNQPAFQPNPMQNPPLNNDQDVEMK